ncbi:hypothetical protein BJX66DRAFT_332955 [Aspergillus keveii]|uniref:Uncharacterized protein n=1 Tax=Aspergillus keveii TaxID=714993 RepID=A0ABR4GLI0_9EURO
MMRPQLFDPLWALLVILAALAVMAPAFPTPSALADPESDYVIPSWEVVPYPGAAPILLNGTVEQVYAKLHEMNPNYDIDWENEDDSDIDIDVDIESNTALDLELERREREHNDFYLPSFNNIADGAQVILNICGKDSKKIKGWLGHGDDKWRVNVFYLREVPNQGWC